jgi:riboflavin kinase/FMN adenylyltransferase
MSFFRSFHSSGNPPCVLTIGNFDGVHLGHQALLRRLTQRAGEQGIAASVLTFEPHPREFFAPNDAPARLTSLREKLALLADHGAERIHVQRFDTRFAGTDAQGFVDDVLMRGLKLRHLLVGDDFRFGSDRAGDFAMLQAAGRARGFKVEAMPTLAIEGERVSSSAVRRALMDGDLPHAARLLGRPYSLAGRVMHGDKLGRRLGFPTINLPFRHRRPPLAGVFAVRVEGLDAQHIPGVANAGLRPTAGGVTQARLEVHLLDWSGECYGAPVRVHFFHKLRDEIRFPSLDALKAQIGQDLIAARVWFSQHLDRPRG